MSPAVAAGSEAGEAAFRRQACAPFALQPEGGANLQEITGGWEGCGQSLGLQEGAVMSQFLQSAPCPPKLSFHSGCASLSAGEGGAGGGPGAANTSR